MTRLPICIHRSFLSCLAALVLLIGSSAQADVITQTALITQTNPDYVYWNAEDFDRLEFTAGGPTWGVNFDPGGNSVSGRSLISSGGDNNNGDDDSFAIYKFNFTTPGTYTFYAYRLGGGDDSMFPPPDFGVVPSHDPDFGQIDIRDWGKGFDSSGVPEHRTRFDFCFRRPRALGEAEQPADRCLRQPVPA